MRIARSAVTFLYTLAIYVGLPLVGWGVGDAPGFFSLPQRTGYAASIGLFGLLAGYLIQLPGGMGNTLGKGEQGKFVPRQRLVRICVSAMLLGALLFVPYADRRGLGTLANSPAMRWTGLALEVAGMGLIFWSGWALGRLYSPEVTLQKEHHLTTDGVYRYIRHPRYLGGIVQGMGLSLLFRSCIGLVLTLMFTVIILFRIRDEEAMMSQAFGAEWQDYCQKSWRLAPFIF